ncbi:MAG: outer membrane protein assembly factor BamD [Candidatus Aminicenantes bacterium]|nr:outer membrane protein assembly factor BamD [Candidatus Aminicenantes bacterium]
MNQKIITGLALVCLIVAAADCGKKAKAVVVPGAGQAASDEALYKEGEQYLKKDPERARLYMRQVIDSFPKSFYAQRAKLAVADTYFRENDEGNLILAAAEYAEFIRLFPYSPSASFAQYRIALSFFNKALKPGRDQQKTLQALAEFKKVLSIYPLSEEAKTARQGILNCEERLAQHAVLIAEHYVRTKAYAAAVDRLIEILTSYPSFSGMEQVYYYLGLCYVGWNKADQAVPYLTKLVTDYPKSKLAVKGQKLLAEAKTAKPPVPPPAKPPVKK